MIIAEVNNMEKPNMYYILKSSKLKVIDIVEEVIDNILRKDTDGKYLLIIGTGYFGDTNNTYEVMDKMKLTNCSKSFDVLLIGNNHGGKLYTDKGAITRFGETVNLFLQERHNPAVIRKPKHHSKYFFVFKLDSNVFWSNKEKAISLDETPLLEIEKERIDNLITEIDLSTAVMYYGGSTNYNKNALIKDSQDESDLVLINKFGNEIFSFLSGKLEDRTVADHKISEITIVPGYYENAFNTANSSMDDVIKNMAKNIVKRYGKK